MFKVLPLEMDKLSATENDFIFIGLDSPAQQENMRKLLKGRSGGSLAQILCNRRNGLGADGLLFLSPSSPTDWSWEFYNRDGSTAEMCGNAARCAGLWAARKHNSWRSFSFATGAGPVMAQKVGRNIQVTMPQARVLESEFALTPTAEKLCYINSGVPHVIVPVDARTKRRDLFILGRTLRNHPHFSPHGTNVTFVRSLKNNCVHALTYERGVENFTRACGTGAVAAALWQKAKSGVANVEVCLPGGHVEVSLAGPKPLLTGPAHWVAQFRIYIDDWGMA